MNGSNASLFFLPSSTFNSLRFCQGQGQGQSDGHQLFSLSRENGGTGQGGGVGGGVIFVRGRNTWEASEGGGVVCVCGWVI